MMSLERRNAYAFHTLSMLSYGTAKDPALVREFSSIYQRYQTAPQEALSHFDPFEKQLPDIPPSFE